MRSQSFVCKSQSFTLPMYPPTALTIASRLPCCATIAAISFVTASSSVTSILWPSSRAPSIRSALAALGLRFRELFAQGAIFFVEVVRGHDAIVGFEEGQRDRAAEPAGATCHERYFAGFRHQRILSHTLRALKRCRTTFDSGS